MTPKKEFYPILKDVRSLMEEYAERKKHDYERLNYLCAISSYAVFHHLKKLDFDVSFCTNEGHAFNMVGDWYVDLTIRQFHSTYPLIYCSVEPCREPIDYLSHTSFQGKPIEIHTIQQQTTVDDKIFQLLEGWPSQQNPFFQLKELDWVLNK